jgi:SAM-dependent methyltransferase
MRQDYSPPSFQTYLEQKRPIDERSFDPDVWREARRRLLTTDLVRVLDVGTGTGTMARRLMAAWDADGAETATFRLTGVDLEERSLAEARARTKGLLERLGYGIALCGHGGKGRRTGRTVFYEYEQLDALSLGSLGARFDLVTAHAVLDLLPLDAALQAVVAVLAPRGALYTTINYDGSTQFLPSSSNPTFERELLAWYNKTMDDRRVGGMVTGGSRCGSNMIAAAERAGLKVAVVGSSDWHVKPGSNGYLESEHGLLKSLVWMVYVEGRRSPHWECRLVDHWLAERMAQIENGVLALRVVQTDMLAVLP